MPIAEFKCGQCGIKFEELFRVNEVPDEIPCSCGGVNRRCVSLIASTPGRWGDSHGYFDVGLGKHVKNEMDRERLMKEMGLVSCADYGKHYVDDRLEKDEADIFQHEKDGADVKALEDDGMTKGEALATVYNQERIMGGV